MAGSTCSECGGPIDADYACKCIVDHGRTVKALVAARKRAQEAEARYRKAMDQVIDLGGQFEAQEMAVINATSDADERAQQETRIAELEAEAAAMREALVFLIEDVHGTDLHDRIDCPEDDTCECVPANMINKALATDAGRQLLDRMRKAESERSGTLKAEVIGLRAELDEALEQLRRAEEEREKARVEVEHLKEGMMAAGPIVRTYRNLNFTKAAGAWMEKWWVEVSKWRAGNE